MAYRLYSTSPRVTSVARRMAARSLLVSMVSEIVAPKTHVFSVAAAIAMVSISFLRLSSLLKLTIFPGQCGYRPEHCSPSSPKTCVANCDAKAPCGEFSADGKTSCPLNVCCSRLGFCGTLDVFCRDTAAIAGVDGAADDPSCGKNSGSASRRIAYYQSWYVSFHTIHQLTLT